jgi:hypothetical protein
MVEHLVVVQDVAGSSPVNHPLGRLKQFRRPFFISNPTGAGMEPLFHSLRPREGHCPRPLRYRTEIGYGQVPSRGLRSLARRYGGRRSLESSQSFQTLDLLAQTPQQGYLGCETSARQGRGEERAERTSVRDPVCCRVAARCHSTAGETEPLGRSQHAPQRMTPDRAQDRSLGDPV